MNFSCWKVCWWLVYSMHTLRTNAKIKTCEMPVRSKLAKISSCEKFYLYNRCYIKGNEFGSRTPVNYGSGKICLTWSVSRQCSLAKLLWYSFPGSFGLPVGKQLRFLQLKFHSCFSLAIITKDTISEHDIHWFKTVEKRWRGAWLKSWEILRRNVLARHPPSYHLGR